MQSRPVSTTEIRRKIDNVLRRSIMKAAAGIFVDVQGSKVTLLGKVHDRYERGVARRAACCAPAVMQMEDRLGIA